jgi:hypothetical protein
LTLRAIRVDRKRRDAARRDVVRAGERQLPGHLRVARPDQRPLAGRVLAFPLAVALRLRPRLRRGDDLVVRDLVGRIRALLVRLLRRGDRRRSLLLGRGRHGGARLLALGIRIAGTQRVHAVSRRRRHDLRQNAGCDRRAHDHREHRERAEAVNLRLIIIQRPLAN